MRDDASTLSTAARDSKYDRSLAVNVRALFTGYTAFHRIKSGPRWTKSPVGSS